MPTRQSLHVRQGHVPLAASLTITPALPLPLFGNVARRGPSSGAASELEANLISLPADKGLIILIGLDTLFASRQLKQAILGKLSAGQHACIAELALVATHTHNAPSLDPTKPRLGEFDEGYLETTASAIAKAISTALASSKLAPVSLTRGMATCKLNALRRQRGLRVQQRWPFVRRAINLTPVHNSLVPRDLDLLVARDQAGTPQWVIWQWCCHATAQPDVNTVAADFPGHVRSLLRSRLQSPTLPVVFLPGFCGDVRSDPSIWPVSLASLLMTPLQRPFPQQTPRNFKLLCAGLTEAVDNALGAMRPLGTTATARAARGTIPLRDLISDGDPYTDSTGMDIIAINAGALGLLLAGAEVCSPYIAKLAPVLPDGWLLSGCSDHVFGYLPDDRQIAEGGYEAAGFFEPFGLSGAFKSNIENGVVRTMQDVAARVLTPG